jgi:hypothetical protein
MCVDYVLASPRIAQVDPDDEPLPEVVLSHCCSLWDDICMFIYDCLAWDQSPYTCGDFAQIATSFNFISNSLLHVCYLLVVYL